MQSMKKKDFQKATYKFFTMQ